MQTHYITPEEQEYITARVGGPAKFAELQRRVAALASAHRELQEEHTRLQRIDLGYTIAHSVLLVTIILVIGWLLYLGLKYGWLFGA